MAVNRKITLGDEYDPEGYTAEKKKGNIKIIPGKGSVTFTVTAGYLDKKDAEGMREHIGSR